MVICEKYNFIFIRIPKNASTSLAAFFIKNCCNTNDIYTRVWDADILTQNVDDNIISKYVTNYKYVHLTLNEILENNIITKTEAKLKKVISVIRDPLERQLSLFFFRNKKINLLSPADFRKEFRNGYHETDLPNQILQKDYTKIDNIPVGEYWLYEKIDQCLRRFVMENNIIITAPLKNYKSHFKRKDDNLLNQYYDKYTIDAVKEYYKEDFELYERLLDEN